MLLNDGSEIVFFVRNVTDAAYDSSVLFSFYGIAAISCVRIGRDPHAVIVPSLTNYRRTYDSASSLRLFAFRSVLLASFRRFLPLPARKSESILT